MHTYESGALELTIKALARYGMEASTMKISFELQNESGESLQIPELKLIETPLQSYYSYPKFITLKDPGTYRLSVSAEVPIIDPSRYDAKYTTNNKIKKSLEIKVTEPRTYSSSSGAGFSSSNPFSATMKLLKSFTPKIEGSFELTFSDKSENTKKRSVHFKLKNRVTGTRFHDGKLDDFEISSLKDVKKTYNFLLSELGQYNLSIYVNKDKIFSKDFVVQKVFEVQKQDKSIKYKQFARANFKIISAIDQEVTINYDRSDFLIYYKRNFSGESSLITTPIKVKSMNSKEIIIVSLTDQKKSITFKTSAEDEDQIELKIEAEKSDPSEIKFSVPEEIEEGSILKLKELIIPFGVMATLSVENSRIIRPSLAGRDFDDSEFILEDFYVYKEGQKTDERSWDYNFKEEDLQFKVGLTGEQTIILKVYADNKKMHLIAEIEKKIFIKKKD